MEAFNKENNRHAKEAEVVFRELDVALSQHFSVALASPALAHAINVVEKLVDEKLGPLNSNPYIGSTRESVKGYCRDETIKRFRSSREAEASSGSRRSQLLETAGQASTEFRAHHPLSR